MSDTALQDFLKNCSFVNFVYDYLVIRVKDRDNVVAVYNFDYIKLFDIVDEGGGCCLRIFTYDCKDPTYYRISAFTFCFMAEDKHND